LSTLGIIPNIFADKIGPFNVVIPCALISAILCMCFIAVDSTAGIVSMNARDKIGTRLGQSFAFVGFGVLIGTPIGGAVLDRGGFTALWAFGGAMLFASGALLATARVSWVGWTVLKKA
jgi:predicted MFS family arabinose efflux permease